MKLHIAFAVWFTAGLWWDTPLWSSLTPIHWAAVALFLGTLVASTQHIQETK